MKCGWPHCSCPPFDGSETCPKYGGERHTIDTFGIGLAPWWHEKYAPVVYINSAIHYAVHKDNEDGWVQRFEENLDRMISEGLLNYLIGD